MKAEIDGKKGAVTFGGDIEDLVQRPGVARIVQLLGINFVGGTAGHSNALIWDVPRKQVHLFEPNGHDTDWTDTVTLTIAEYIQSRSLLREFKLVPPVDYCPAVFAQGISQTINCANWSLLLCTLAINCHIRPIADTIKLVEKMGEGQNGRDQLRLLMQKFAAWLNDYWIVSGIDELWKCSDMVDVLVLRFKDVADYLPRLDADPPVADTYIKLLAKQRVALGKFYKEHRAMYERCRTSIIRASIAESLHQILSGNSSNRKELRSLMGRFAGRMPNYIRGWDPEQLIERRDKICKVRSKWVSKIHRKV